MIIHNSAQSYTRPEVNIGIGVRQQSGRCNVGEFPGGVLLWKAIGRVALAVCATTVVFTLLLGAYSTRLGSRATELETQRHQLMDRNIALRATRAGMLTRRAVEAAAGKALSLYPPGESQRFVYNRNKGRFENL